MPSESRYFRNISHTINGLTAKRLDTAADAGSSNQMYASGTDYDAGATYVSVHVRFDIYRRQSGGSMSLLGSGVASRTHPYDSTSSETANWSCPATSLNPTDAIQIRPKFQPGNDGTVTGQYWITEQLGYAALNSATWTIGTRLFVQWKSFLLLLGQDH